MKSYTPFLKANRSLLFSLNSIKGRRHVRVKAHRTALPARFAQEFSTATGDSVRLSWNPADVNHPEDVCWTVCSSASEDACDLYIKPLRERAADLPALLEHFFAQLPLSLSEKRFLVAADWPGDLLQLQAVAQAKALEPAADVRGLHATPEDELMISILIGTDKTGFWDDIIRERGLKGTADLFVEQLIERQLVTCKGNVSRAARHLKVPPTTLYSRISSRRKHLDVA